MGGFRHFFQWIIVSAAMASILIFIIVFIKLIFKNKLTPSWHYYIWFLLFIRLIMPYAPKSSLSIFNIIRPSTMSISINEENKFSYSEKEKSRAVYNKENLLDVYEEVVPKQNENSIKLTKVEMVYIDIKNIYSNIETKLIFIWIVGIVILISRTIMINIRHLLKNKMYDTVSNESVIYTLNECKYIMKIKNNIPIIVSSITDTPCLSGITNPKIILPQELLGKLNCNQLKYIFFHELVHFKRKDIAINWLMVFLQILYWFNPVIWYGFYRMRYDCEIACDATVLSYVKEEEYKEYGHTLIDLLEIISEPQWIPGTTKIIKNKSEIERRIIMISLFKKKSLKWTITATILFLLIGCVGLTSAKEAKPLKLFQSAYKNNEQSLKQMRNNEILTGSTDVEGKGVIITLTDKSQEDSSSSSDNFEYALGLVNVEDIRKITNELKNNGVEVISVNNERLLGNSEINYEGMKLIINGNKIEHPFVIKAIGNPNLLEDSTKSKESMIRLLKLRDIGVKIEKSDKLLIPKINKNISFRYNESVKTINNEEI